MRVTISHNKPKAQVIEAVDRAIEDAFRGLAIAPIQISGQRKTWNGSVMDFSFTAEAGFLKNPIRGTVIVTDTDLTIDADLGVFNRFISGDRVRAAIESHVRALLA